MHITSTSRALHSSWTEASRGDRISPEHVIIQQSDKRNGYVDANDGEFDEGQGCKHAKVGHMLTGNGILDRGWSYAITILTGVLPS